MGDWPRLVLDGLHYESVGQDTSDSRGTTVTAGSANVKGSFTQIVASTGIDAQGVIVILSGISQAGTFYLDIGIGAATEEVIIPDLFGKPVTTTGSMDCRWFLPINIPAGSRLTARLQHSVGSATVDVSLILVGQGMAAAAPFGSMRAYGLVASTDVTAVDPGTTANTKGSWTQIVASTTEDIEAALLYLSGDDISLSTDVFWLVDIAIGASSSEEIVIANIPVCADNSSEVSRMPYLGPIPFKVPAGSRIAIRAQCSSTSSSDRLFDAALWGLN